MEKGKAGLDPTQKQQTMLKKREKQPVGKFTSPRQYTPKANKK